MRRNASMFYSETAEFCSKVQYHRKAYNYISSDGVWQMFPSGGAYTTALYSWIWQRHCIKWRCILVAISLSQWLTWQVQEVLHTANCRNFSWSNATAGMIRLWKQDEWPLGQVQISLLCFLQWIVHHFKHGGMKRVPTPLGVVLINHKDRFKIDYELFKRMN